MSNNVKVIRKQDGIPEGVWLTFVDSEGLESAFSVICLDGVLVVRGAEPLTVSAPDQNTIRVTQVEHD